MKKILSSIIVVLLMVGMSFAQTPPKSSLSWTFTPNPGRAVSGFVIERRDGPFANTAAPWKEIARILSPAMRAYDDLVIVRGSEYCYRAAAFDSQSVGSWSNVACGLSPVLVIPDLVITLQMAQAVGKPGTTIEVRWNEALAGATDKDWVGLFVSTANQNVEDMWKYIGKLPAGTFTVTITKPGRYNFRRCSDDTYSCPRKTIDFIVA